MAADTPVPLCSLASMQRGAFADLIKMFDPAAVTEMLAEATRACETECDRRLAPFTGLVETHRLTGVDPDEYSDSSSLPLDLAGTLGRSWGAAMNSGTDLVRHVWVNQTAVHYPEYWAYSNVSVSVTRSYGGGQIFQADQFDGPDVDTGHLWFRLGTWLPVGSFAKIIYSGGYQTIPSDLARACKYMTAAIACRELNPMQANHGHDADSLEALAVSWVSAYARGA